MLRAFTHSAARRARPCLAASAFARQPLPGMLFSSARLSPKRFQPQQQPTSSKIQFFPAVPPANQTSEYQALINKAGKIFFQDLMKNGEKVPVIIGIVHHLFPSAIAVIEQLSEVFAEIYVLGKPYSTSPFVKQSLEKTRNVHLLPNRHQERYGQFDCTFNKDIRDFLEAIEQKAKQLPSIKGIILLDHGGDVVAAIPSKFARDHRIVAQEGTTQGLMNPKVLGAPLNVIAFAHAAFKRYFEPIIIAEEGVKGLMMSLGVKELPKDKVIGVIGYGTIGKHFSHLLISLDCKVLIYEKNASVRENSAYKHLFVSTFEELMNKVDTAVGTSGQDNSATDENFAVIDRINHKVEVVSLSSGDTEWRRIGQAHQEQNRAPDYRYQPFKPFTYYTKNGGRIVVLNGGTPINMQDPSLFPEGQNELSPKMDIAVTRLATLAGVRHCYDLLGQDNAFFAHPKNHILDPDLQQQLTNLWLETQPSDRFDETLRENFQSPRWIAEHSRGNNKEIDLPITLEEDTSEVNFSCGLH